MDLVQVLDLSWCSAGGIENVQNIVHTIITIIQVAIPVLLIIFGMLDLGKAVVASKEDEIKKGQQTFIKRLIAAAIVFLVIFIVKIVVNVLVPNGNDTVNNEDLWSCANKFINGPGANSNKGGQ